MNLGLVVALKAEASAVLGRGRWRSAGGKRLRSLMLGDGSGDVEVTAALSGMGLENAAAAARVLVEAGAGFLLSVGVAGGLSPELKAGDLVVAGEVITGEGLHLQADREAAARARTVLSATGMTVHAGAVVSAAGPVLTAKERASLYASSHALTVDMESEAVASVAAGAGIPFFVMRAVSDGAGDSVSPDIYECLDRDGSVSPYALVRKVLGRPSMVKEMLSLRRGFNAALKALSEGWGALVKGGVFLSD